MAILVPLILLSPAILLYVGLRGRSVKEAQANVSVLLFAASILPVVQMFMRRKDPEWLLSVPIAGQYALLSRVLRGDALVFQEWLQAFAHSVAAGARRAAARGPAAVEGVGAGRALMPARCTAPCLLAGRPRIRRRRCARGTARAPAAA